MNSAVTATVAAGLSVTSTSRYSPVVASGVSVVVPVALRKPMEGMFEESSSPR